MNVNWRVSGYSLIELTVVISLMMLLGCIAIPSMTKSVKVAKTSSAAKAVLAFIDDAKSVAIMRKQTLWIEVNEGELWQLKLRTSQDTSNESNVLQKFSERFELTLDSSYASGFITVDGRKGKISIGALNFVNLETSLYQFSIKTSYGAGRVRVCSSGVALHDIPSC